MADKAVTLYEFENGQKSEILVADAVADEEITGGHGGGDRGIMRSFCQFLTGTYTGNSVTDITTSIENHLVTVSLPATGGVGTGVVYGAGAAVILLALLGLVLMNRKRGRGTGI
jgi:LPXTG-motif cell wall-anchored protein